MKRIISIVSCLMIAGCAVALDAVMFTIPLTAGTTNTHSIKPVSGKVVYAAIYQTQATGTTNAVSFTTTARTGATVGTARTIVASTNVTTATVESSPSVYLRNDTVTMTAISSGVNANAGNVWGVLVLENP